MLFYLGTHRPHWLGRVDIPLFVSRRTLAPRKGLPQATERWALDSGGFTELNLYDQWVTTPQEYVADVRRFADGIGLLDWVSPQDWMCEPFMLEKTGLTVGRHQIKTVANFRVLREQLGELVIPVLQGWNRDDYLYCWELYDLCGVNLEAEPIVGLGSVCRRQNTPEAEEIVRSLAPLRLHYYGAKMTGLASFSDALTSADSMAWSYNGRFRRGQCPGGKKNCANCLHHALGWRDQLLERLTHQPEVAA